MAVCDLYLLIIIGKSDAAEETSPSLLNGGLPGTAMPHASCPRCCKARNESMTKGITLCPSSEKIPIKKKNPNHPEFLKNKSPPPNLDLIKIKFIKNIFFSCLHSF